MRDITACIVTGVQSLDIHDEILVIRFWKIVNSDLGIRVAVVGDVVSSDDKIGRDAREDGDHNEVLVDVEHWGHVVDAGVVLIGLSALVAIIPRMPPDSDSAVPVAPVGFVADDVGTPQVNVGTVGIGHSGAIDGRYVAFGIGGDWLRENGEDMQRRRWGG